MLYAIAMGQIKTGFLEHVQKPVATISDRTELTQSYDGRTTGYASSRVAPRQVARWIVRP